MPPFQTKTLTEIMLEKGYITSEELKKALEYKKDRKISVETALLELGYANDDELAKCLALQLGLPYNELNSCPVSDEALDIISEEIAANYLFIPVKADKDSLTIATYNPTDITLKGSLEFATGKRIFTEVSTEARIRKAIHECYKSISPTRICDLLLEMNVITEQQHNIALDKKKTSKKRIGEILVDLGFVTETEIANSLSIQLGVPYIDLDNVNINEDALKAVPAGIAIKHLVIPIDIDNSVITIAMANPFDTRVINALSFSTLKRARVFVSTAMSIKNAIVHNYKNIETNRLGMILADKELVSITEKDIEAVEAEELKGDDKAQKQKIGDILKKEGIINDEQLLLCLRKQKETSKRFGEIVVEQGFASEKDIALAFSHQLNIKFTDLDNIAPDKEAIAKVPKKLAEEYLVMPLMTEKRNFIIAMANPLDYEAIDKISFATGKTVKQQVATPIEIRKSINKFYNKAEINKLGDILLKAGVITKDQMSRALDMQKNSYKRLGDILIDLGYVTDKAIAHALSRQLGIPYSDLSKSDSDARAMETIKKEIIINRLVIPVKFDKGALVVAMANPLDLSTINLIKRSSGKNLNITVSSESEIRNVIHNYFHTSKDIQRFTKRADELKTSSEQIEVADLVIETQTGDIGDEKVIIGLTNQLILDGYNKGASDIHIEPLKNEGITEVRYRIDGVCIKYVELPLAQHNSIISRIKVMANLKIEERRLPQDGKIKLTIKERNRIIELRVAILPTVNGEAAVLRILSSSRPIPLVDLQLSDRNIFEFKQAATKPYGIILVVGPTGSGKTTTLHAALNYINSPDRKIWTIEDPVEITQRGLCQVEVKNQINFNFAKAIRSFLRADPDVIMVGEIRDRETASIAIEASLTGHLVFSTLHTNSASETITRLLDLGMDAFNFSDAVIAILAQRLVRVLCANCKEQYTPDAKEVESLLYLYGADYVSELGIRDYKSIKLYRSSGCEYCNSIGYKGRVGVHELLIGTDSLKNLIRAKAAVDVIKAQAIKDGMRTIAQDGIAKIFKGLTDLEQVKRVSV
ncbi:type IV-A pilus assembly ATPase PilB [Candidatus Magnetoovum chiemensis]|nr:type IV-A pilus assembly ATPase PilB [Candidatus Magnetoovum chiemensis]